MKKMNRESREKSPGGSLHEQVVAFVLTRKNEELAHLDTLRIGSCFGIDGGSLAREFSTRQGLSLDRFITREKIYRAFFEIEHNLVLSGSEISRRLGFSDPALFDREFKNIFLIEPDKLIRLKKRSRTGAPRFQA